MAEDTRNLYTIRRLTWTSPLMVLKGVRSCRARQLIPRMLLNGIGTFGGQKRPSIAFLSPPSPGALLLISVDNPGPTKYGEPLP